MPAVARLLQKARERRRDALCQRRDASAAPSSSASCSRARGAGDGIRPSLGGHDGARASRAGPSPFQPSLTDPRNVQRFSAAAPTTRDAHALASRHATGDSERHRAAVGRRRNRLRLHRRDRQEEESEEEARRSASAAAATAAVARRAAGRRRSHQRAADQGAGALCRRLQAAGCAAAAAGAAAAGCLRAARHPRRQLPAEACRSRSRAATTTIRRTSRTDRHRATRWSSRRSRCSRNGRGMSSASICAAATATTTSCRR